MATQRSLGMESVILMWVCIKATPVCHHKGRYYPCFTGVKIYFMFNLDPLLPRMSERFQTSTALRVRGLQRFSCLGFIRRAGGNR